MSGKEHDGEERSCKWKIISIGISVNSNINLNKILQVVLSIFLQLRCKWILKKYRVENDNDDDAILKAKLQLECECESQADDNIPNNEESILLVSSVY